MSTRTYDERIDELIKKREQLKAQERALRKRRSEDDRKKRTKRLIELGAIVESVLERPITDDDKIKLKAFLERQEHSGKYFSRAMNSQIAEGDTAVSRIP